MLQISLVKLQRGNIDKGYPQSNIVSTFFFMNDNLDRDIHTGRTNVNVKSGIRVYHHWRLEESHGTDCFSQPSEEIKSVTSEG